MRRRVFIHLAWGGQTVIIPEVADSIRVEQAGAPTIQNIIGIGQIATWSHPEAKRLIVENQQFNERWISKYIEGGWTPRQYVDWLIRLRNTKGAYAELTIESEIPTLRHNFYVWIDFAHWEVQTNDESNIRYSLVLHEVNLENATIKRLEQTTQADGSTAIQEPPSPRYDNRPPQPEVYTVVSGDSLIKIARMFGQPDGAWRELYTLNQDVIHQRAGAYRQGSLIFPGQQFSIPANWR